MMALFKQEALEGLTLLEASGFEAYLVGGLRAGFSHGHFPSRL